MFSSFTACASSIVNVPPFSVMALSSLNIRSMIPGSAEILQYRQAAAILCRCLRCGSFDTSTDLFCGAVGLLLILFVFKGLYLG